MASWVEGHQQWLTTVLVAMMSKKKGGDYGEICSASMHRGDYEPEAALVECGVRRLEGRKQRRQESSELGWPYTHA
jgi:hypothetical protein